jgi:hypothetical protein
MTMAETFVLLHGSWHGGWAWEPTAWCLRELGHAVYTPTYPGHWPGASRDVKLDLGEFYRAGLPRTEHLAEWWFALRAHDLLTGRSPG